MSDQEIVITIRPISSAVPNVTYKINSVPNQGIPPSYAAHHAVPAAPIPPFRNSNTVEAEIIALKTRIPLLETQKKTAITSSTDFINTMKLADAEIISFET